MVGVNPNSGAAERTLQCVIPVALGQAFSRKALPIAVEAFARDFNGVCHVSLSDEDGGTRFRALPPVDPKYASPGDVPGYSPAEPVSPLSRCGPVRPRTVVFPAVLIEVMSRSLNLFTCCADPNSLVWASL